jgi:hypothetical protein
MQIQTSISCSIIIPLSIRLRSNIASLMNYNIHFIFIKIHRVEDVWTWIGTDFLNTLRNDSFLVDDSSFVLGYPKIRQSRVKTGNFFLPKIKFQF